MTFLNMSKDLFWNTVADMNNYFYISLTIIASTLKTWRMKYILLVCLLGCAGSKQRITAVDTTITLNGTFTPYQAAMGSGRGILFRVPVSFPLDNSNIIDSFYLNAQAHAFTIIKAGKETYLEANYFAPDPPAAALGNQAADTGVEKKSDPVITLHQFYPSWIIVKQRSVNKRININSFTEIIPNSKY